MKIIISAMIAAAAIDSAMTGVITKSAAIGLAAFCMSMVAIGLASRKGSQSPLA